MSDTVGADVLCDAARFARCDAGLADGIHECGLAVIDMAHEGDNRRAVVQFFDLWLLGFLGFGDYGNLMNATTFLAFFLFKRESVFGADFGRDLGFDCLID